MYAYLPTHKGEIGYCLPPCTMRRSVKLCDGGPRQSADGSRLRGGSDESNQDVFLVCPVPNVPPVPVLEVWRVPVLLETGSGRTCTLCVWLRRQGRTHRVILCVDREISRAQ